MDDRRIFAASYPEHLNPFSEEYEEPGNKYNTFSGRRYVNPRYELPTSWTLSRRMKYNRWETPISTENPARQILPVPLTRHSLPSPPRRKEKSVEGRRIFSEVCTTSTPRASRKKRRAPPPPVPKPKPPETLQVPSSTDSETSINSLLSQESAGGSDFSSIYEEDETKSLKLNQQDLEVNINAGEKSEDKDTKGNILSAGEINGNCITQEDICPSVNISRSDRQSTDRNDEDLLNPEVGAAATVTNNEIQNNILDEKNENIKDSYKLNKLEWNNHVNAEKQGNKELTDNLNNQADVTTRTETDAEINNKDGGKDSEIIKNKKNDEISQKDGPKIICVGKFKVQKTVENNFDKSIDSLQKDGNNKSAEENKSFNSNLKDIAYIDDTAEQFKTCISISERKNAIVSQEKKSENGVVITTYKSLIPANGKDEYSLKIECENKTKNDASTNTATAIAKAKEKSEDKE